MPTSESERQIFLAAFFVRLRRVRQIISSAHGIEQHIRKMPRIVGLVTGMLHTVVLCHDSP